MMNKYFKVYIIYIAWCILLILPYLIVMHDCKKHGIENFKEDLLSTSSRDNLLLSTSSRDNLLLSTMLKAVGPLENPKRIQTVHRKTIEPTIDIGGWNNIKMALETIICVAAKYNRSVIVPKPTSWYLVPGDNTHLFDFFDEESFKSVVPTSDKINSESSYLFEENNCLIKTTSAMQDGDFKKFDTISNFNNWVIDSRKCRHFTYYTRHFTQNKYDILVNKAFRIRKDIIVIACNLLKKHNLELSKFNAIHIRKGEFQYKDSLWGNDTAGRVISKIKKYVKGVPLLIVSDEYNKKLIKELGNIVPRVVCWSKQDIAEPKIAPIVDMLCCIPAKHFFGTSLSTFSTGIMQWRGYMKSSGCDIDDIPRFIQEQNFCVSCAGDIEQDTWKNL
mgnify:FL=1